MEQEDTEDIPTEDIEEIENIQDIEDTGEEPEPWYRGPIRFVIAAFLLLLIVIWLIPYYGVKFDPMPERIPEISEVYFGGNIEEMDHEIQSKSDILKFLDPTNPIIKQTATRIVTIACPSGNEICYAKAIFFFVRDKFQYVSDPSDEYIETAEEVLSTGGSDCDGAAVLLANLLEAVGVQTRFVFVPGHVYVQARMPEAAGRYKDEFGWVNLDATCTSCGFGEKSWKSDAENAVYV